MTFSPGLPLADRYVTAGYNSARAHSVPRGEGWRRRGKRTVEVGGDTGGEAAHGSDGEGAAQVDHARQGPAVEGLQAVLAQKVRGARVVWDGW